MRPTSVRFIREGFTELVLQMIAIRRYALFCPAAKRNKEDGKKIMISAVFFTSLRRMGCQTAIMLTLPRDAQ